MSQQAKFSLTDTQVEFLRRHRDYGFKDRSGLVRAALAMYQAELERTQLEQSAALYARLYETDRQAQAWNQDALLDWPE